jgi:hypothetical protein
MTDPRQKRERRFSSPRELIRAALAAVFPREKMQVPKRQTRYCYSDGPMYFLGQQIVKAMQDAGHPAVIIECFRTPQRQRELKAKGRSKAGPWESPHQYFEAVDIIHPSFGWDVSQQYWDALAACVRNVSERYSVALEHGHYWRFRDSAHIEIKEWRVHRDRHRRRVLRDGQERQPNSAELWERFCEVLPAVAADFQRGR